MSSSPRDLAGEPPEKGMRLVFTPKFSADGRTWVVESAKWIRKSDVVDTVEMSMEGFMDAYSPNKDWRGK